ncbi:MAG: hypothetical protein ACFB0B_08680 [Thermonemataceae bacterium]
MGLKEKRAIKEVEDNQYPAFKQKVADIIGFEVALEINWESLAREGSDHIYKEGFEKVFVTPTLEAFESICQDDMGKEAIKEALKKIVIKDENDHFSYTQWVDFKEGILTLDHKIDTNLDDIAARKGSLQETLESAL